VLEAAQGALKTGVYVASWKAGDGYDAGENEVTGTIEIKNVTEETKTPGEVTVKITLTEDSE
jgi:hypothetical protein